MFRSCIALALCTIPAFAQRSPTWTPDPASRAPVQSIDLDTVRIEAGIDVPHDVVIEGIGATALASISLERDLLSAVQGNVDRERMERTNGESR
jgi:hypothetical protein